MSNSKRTNDLLVIGGGAAGFFAAINAAELQPGMRITILERGRDVLQKVRISGGGRCNVTHAVWTPRELSKYYPRGGRELLGPFTRFCTGDTIEWFERRGVELKIEEDGRMFPVTDDSQTIIDCLTRAAKRLNIRVLTQRAVVSLYPPEQAGQPFKAITRDGNSFYGSKLLVATGSNPKVWDLIGHLGHRIVPPVPSLFTFNTKDTRLRNLSGVSAPNATVKIPALKMEESGPLLVTHWGKSGPAILKMSAWGARELHPLDYKFALHVNWLGQKWNPQSALDRLRELKEELAKKQIGTYCPFEFPLRLWKNIIGGASIAESTRWADLNKRQLHMLADELTRAEFQIAGKSTNKEEFVTAGGVALREVDFKRFASKIFPDLHFAGEILDIDAVTGGFNFQAAWTGGYLAARAIANISDD